MAENIKLDQHKIILEDYKSKEKKGVENKEIQEKCPHQIHEKIDRNNIKMLNDKYVIEFLNLFINIGEGID